MILLAVRLKWALLRGGLRSGPGSTQRRAGMIASVESPLDLLSQPRKKPKKAKEKSRKDQPTA